MFGQLFKLDSLCVTRTFKAAAGHLYNDDNSNDHDDDVDGSRHHCEVKHVETLAIDIKNKNEQQLQQKH